MCSDARSAAVSIKFSTILDLESVSWVSPIRNLGEDGSLIVNYCNHPSAIPLFFPKLVSTFDFMDFGNRKFYTLEQLSSNPKLGPSPVFRQLENNYYDESIDTKQNKKVLSLENRLRELEQKLLDKETKPVHRPDDEELKAFIMEGDNRLSQEERLAYLSRIFAEEHSNKAPVSNVSPNYAESIKPNHNQSVDYSNISNKSDFISPPLPPTFDSSLIHYPQSHRAASETRSILRFKASVPTAQGKERPAQASEFYLTTRNLQDLLSDLNLDRAIAGEVNSVAELWANAEKDSSLNPEVALGVKSILLQAKVGKARTDPFGKAELNDVFPDDKYYLIGIDKDDRTGVVTIWSKHVEVTPGENMVELTTNDVIYQD